MSPSSATHDTLTRPPLWRGVARPRMLPMPIVLPAPSVLFQTIDTSRAKRAFDVIINDTTSPSALVASTVAAGIAMRSRWRVAAAHNGALWIAIGVAMALIRYNVGAITDDRLRSRARPTPTALLRQPTWPTRPVPSENGAASD